MSYLFLLALQDTFYSYFTATVYILLNVSDQAVYSLINILSENVHCMYSMGTLT